MSDISAPKRQILTSFGVDQMTNNPAGIGNECTHWIYAALFESRALDSDAHLHIRQTGVNYTWGRRVNATAVQRGDIAQFHGFQNRFFIYLPDGAGGTRWAELTKIRGPLHTGMVFAPPRSGTYYQLESHLHEAGTILMRIRGHTIYYESFAVAIPMADFNSIKGSTVWPANINPTDYEDLLERVDWVGLRTNRSIDLQVAAAQILRIRKNQTPTIGGQDVAVLFRVQTTGNLSFFCPQESTARLAMNADQLAVEKAKLIQSMIRSGRVGRDAHADEFGGDNKRQRIHDHRFNWTYTQPQGIENGAPFFFANNPEVKRAPSETRRNRIVERGDFTHFWSLLTIKRRINASQHFRSFWCAWCTIAGYEAIHMIRKGQAYGSAAGAKVMSVTKEVAGIHVPRTRSLFGGSILRWFRPLVSPVKPTSAHLQ